MRDDCTDWPHLIPNPMIVEGAAGHPVKHFASYDNWRYLFDVAKDSKGLADLVYPALGLNGEAGEVAEKVKKIIRDKAGVVVEMDRLAILRELGDVLWYLSAIAHQLDSNLAEVAQMNIDKLKSRQERGTLHGNGDNR